MRILHMISLSVLCIIKSIFDITNNFYYFPFILFNLLIYISFICTNSSLRGNPAQDLGLA